MEDLCKIFNISYIYLILGDNQSHGANSMSGHLSIRFGFVWAFTTDGASVQILYQALQYLLPSYTWIHEVIISKIWRYLCSICSISVYYLQKAHRYFFRCYYESCGYYYCDNHWYTLLDSLVLYLSIKVTLTYYLLPSYLRT